MSEENMGIPYIEMMIKSLRLLGKIMPEFNEESYNKEYEEIKGHYIDWKRAGLEVTLNSLTSQLQYELDHIESMKYEGFIIDKKSDRYRDIRKLRNKINDIKSVTDEELLEVFEE